MVGVLGSPKGMQHILPAETPGNGQMPILAAVPLFYPPVQRAACALPFGGSVPSRINRNHSINQISTHSFKLILLF
jgi:hypothetical protein